MWELWVDTGGTFTDGIARAPDGSRRTVKLLSTSALRGVVVAAHGRRLVVDEAWGARADELAGLALCLLGATHEPLAVAGHDPETGELWLDAAPRDPVPAGAVFEVVSNEEAPLFAARLLTGTPPGRPLPPCRMRLATTLATNTLLERRGARLALFVTAGLEGVPEIGTQERPELFALEVRKPAPLHEAVVGVRERLAAGGAVLEPLDLAPIEPVARALVRSGITVAAVALANAYRNPVHERALAARLREWGFSRVSCSAELVPRINLLRRTVTAVVDAALGPVFGGYVERVRAGLGDGSLFVMTSAGGLLGPDVVRPKDALLSGPAGGVVGAALAGRRAGLERLIGFDMGGTSTDVARWAGELEYVWEHRVGEVELAAPAVAIETVAAGGGSICWLDDRRLRVGPRSAGARPGPACYGAGGPLTLTDVNLLLGRLDPRRFEIPVREEPALARLDELALEVEQKTGESPRREALLEGLRAIADETMADAIRRVSLRRGFDPADHGLVAFGGAGGQHACAVAERLGITRIVVPPDAALLSAAGLGHARVERIAVRQVLEPLAETGPRLAELVAELASEARRELARAGVAEADCTIRRRLVQLRFVGQDATLEVEWEPGASLQDLFRERHRELFGHLPHGRAVEVESVQVVVASPDPAPEPAAAIPAGDARAPSGFREVTLDGGVRQSPVFERSELAPGARCDGPALVVERHSTTVVERGWTAVVDEAGALRLERAAVRAPAVRRGEREAPEAIRLELFTHRFTQLVREMGSRLARTAMSTNVKERRDFSCALLDPQGRLVVNAPHIPVHLGALGLCVRRLSETLDMGPGDVVVTNHPAWGGSHLPDVTVVTPVFGDDGRRLGSVASRAHHAEIGGSRPGSMPPAATRLAEEGVVIRPTWLVRRGEPRYEAVRALLGTGPWPSRAIEDNLADLEAAVAANHAGAAGLRGLARAHGAEVVLASMAELSGLATRCLGEALARMDEGCYRAIEHLDDGTPLEVRIDVAAGRAAIDFAGTGPVHPGNLNATPAIVRSAVLYVLRLLLDRPLPLNEGLLEEVELAIPRGLLDPDFPEDPMQAPAVVGGNVETSQRLVDTLLKALGLAACSQGTMNNLIFGGRHFGYYETLGGGTGAGPGFAGAHAVHSHMTNTRVTDVEVLEQRYPVRVARFEVRRGSGGPGRWSGGDGLLRELEFLDEVSLSVLTQHRRVAPYGMRGGRPGARGRQHVVRADGSVEELDPIDAREMRPGDRLVMETPGGGGWGEPG